MKANNTIKTTAVDSADTRSNGIVFAKSKTATAYAFSCVFSEDLQKKIIKQIMKEFNQFSYDFMNRTYRRETPDTYVYTIRMKETELRIEYRLTVENEKSTKQQKITQTFDNLEHAIINLR